MGRTCIVHLIRAAPRWVSYQDRKAVSRMLRDIYTAANEDTARASLDAFQSSELGRRYPQSVKVWREAWERFAAVFAVPVGGTGHGGYATPRTRSNRLMPSCVKLLVTGDNSPTMLPH